MYFNTQQNTLTDKFRHTGSRQNHSYSNYCAARYFCTNRHKVGVLGVTHGHYGVDLLNQLLLFLILKLHVPFREARLPGAILYQYEADLWRNGTT